MKISILMLICMFLLHPFVWSQEMEMASCPYDCCRPDGHAPAAIMTDHIHGKNRWNLGYMGMFSSMSGNRQGTKDITTEDVFQDYAIAPTDMKMQMHMLMAGYGITGKVTLMAMVQWMTNDMQMKMHPSLVGMDMPGMHMHSMSSEMSMKSSGLGDSRLYLLGILGENKNNRLISGLGLSIPTGSITNKMTPMWSSGNDIMSYCMQNGTGSWGLMPSVTYLHQGNKISFGAMLADEFWLNDNNRNYRSSFTANATAWISYQCTRWLSCSIRPDWKFTGKLTGYDSNVQYAAANDPTANTNNYGGHTSKAAFGMNFYVPEGRCRELRFSAEYMMPFAQNLNGIQMKQSQIINLAIQYTFMK